MIRSTLLAISCFALSSLAIAKVDIPKDENVIKTFDTRSMMKSIDDDGELDILVWNMYKGKKDSWEEDFKTLADKSDLLITQEMKLNGKMLRVYETFGSFEYTTATSFFLKGKVRTGVSTISSVPAIEAAFLRTRDREQIVNTSKVSLHTKYRLSNGKILLVINIHAINFVTASKLDNQLSDIASTAIWHTGPTIFAGDFNAWTKKKQKLLRRHMNFLQLSEVKYKASEDHRMKFNGHVLDFIFYRGLELKESTVLGNVIGSDHKPILATFLVK